MNEPWTEDEFYGSVWWRDVIITSSVFSLARLRPARPLIGWHGLLTRCSVTLGECELCIVRSEPGVRLGVTGITVLRRWESSVTSVSAERLHNTTLTCRPCQEPSITCTEIFWPDIRCIWIPNPTKHKLNPTKRYAIDMRVRRLGPVRQWAENMAANYPWPGSRHYRFWFQTVGITWSDSALRVWTMSVLIPTAMDIYLMKMTRLKAAL